MIQNIIDFVNDPAVCTLSFYVLAAGFLYLSRFVIRPAAFVEARPAAVMQDFTVHTRPAAECRCNFFTIWILSCVRIRTYPSEDPDSEPDLRPVRKDRICAIY
ncbi:hypothetical protein QQ991_09450 [Weizmannia coagulans]|uniref:Uncharacterized protein n=3 Tax=Heyndrickxia TaxID=2837504 RepID=A0A0C5CCE4_HEYCO|nr:MULTISPECIES: hypothetical protein [Heyndrickxia]KGT39779.1 hypothetical protein P421_03825 [Heyndrickxia coagulans P38]AEP02419.1 hypothetical protein Bcoa_3247 [Heyndrickxia coagulans 36D1]AJO23180.1 hypothetical protein SB48_HM08orf03774 [Heyndrickxia coagulans]AKN55315.1 hypothetical protein AB434_2910 [Heyndrickxia coagulans]APB36034.1 hypothetical protein BIZ35_03875 [Heyndrickxia coagulans]